MRRTWPAFLETLLEKKVYSAAVGGSSPIQYYLSLSELLFLRPKKVIFNFFSGNNVFNGLNTVRSLNTEIGQAIREILGEPPARLEAPEQIRTAALIKEIDGDTRLDKILEADARTLQDCVCYNDGDIQAFLTPYLVANRTNFDVLGNVYGFKAALLSISLTKILCEEIGAQLFVTYMPTREYTVFSHARNRQYYNIREEEAFKSILVSESRICGNLERHCEANGVIFCDLRDGFLELAASGLYKRETDDIQ